MGRLFNDYYHHQVGIYHVIKTRFKFIALGLLSALFLFLTISHVNAATTVTISGDTSAGENQPGWMFNRDAGTSTPFEFNTDQASIGAGSAYIKPIGSNPSDKFIAENFLLSEISDINNISYDFRIGSGGDATDKAHFYMNVYANFGKSDDTKFYDCRYNIVPVVGSTSSFTTVNFDPTASYPVSTRTDSPSTPAVDESSPYPCPSSPADMDNESPGSTIRVFALNVGDTSASDIGLDGYLDNVVVDKDSEELTTYDFEPFIPECSSEDTTFDTFSTGSVNGQHDWKATGPYDQEVTHNTYGYSEFGCKTLRLSNGVASGSFGDQTFSYNTVNEAGEADSTSGGQSGGTRQNHYEAQFDIASTQTSEQSGLAISVSPDRGDGSRMSYLGFADTSGGIAVTFYDVQGTDNPANFVPTSLGTISRTESHTIKFVIDYIDGPSNDIVKVYIDGVLVHTGTTWENYYRYDSEASAEQTPRTTDSLLFRAGGSSVPSTIDKGFLFDNVGVATSTIAPPSVPVHVSPPDNSYRTTAGQTLINWDDSTGDAGPIKYKYQSSHSSSTNPDGSFTSPVYNSSLLSNSQISTPSTPAGIYYWHVKAIDSLGNESDWSSPWKVTVDNTAPTAPEITFPADEQYFNSTPILNDWTDSNDANGIDHYQIEYVYDDGHTFSGAPYRETTASQRNHTPNTSEQGGVKIRVRAYDAAGNVSDWSNQVHYYYDATAPLKVAGMNIKVSGNSLGCYPFIQQRAITVDWNDSTDPNFDYYEYQADEDKIVPFDFTTTVNTSERSGNIRDEDGTYNYRVRAIDKAGNIGEWSDWCGVTLDRQAPEIDISNIEVSEDKKLSFDLDATDNGPSGLQIVAANIYDETNTTKLIELGSGSPTRLNTPHSGLPSGTPTFSTSLSDVDVNSLAPGVYTIRAYAKDHATNELRFELVQFTIFPIISGETSTDVTTTSVTIEWTTDYPTTSKVIYDTVSHASLGSPPDYDYAFSTPETDTSPKVTFHSVTVTGLTPDTTYYFRTVSHGSPEAVSGEISASTDEESTSSPQSTGGGGGDGSFTAAGFNTTPFNTFGTFGTTTPAPGGGNVLNATDDDNDGNGNENDGEVQADTAGVSSATTAEEAGKSSWSWWWILPIIAALLLLFAILRRRGDEEEA